MTGFSAYFVVVMNDLLQQLDHTMEHDDDVVVILVSSKAHVSLLYFITYLHSKLELTRSTKRIDFLIVANDLQPVKRQSVRLQSQGFIVSRM